MDQYALQKGVEQPRKQQQAYKKIKVLGQGSMGKAYLVQCTEDKKYYVMKRINIGHLSEEQKESASREAQLHSRLSNDHIIAFKQIYHTTKDKLCIIMEYAENGDLDEFIKKQQGKYLAEDTILAYFAQICLGLKQIHQKKIVHRDLKGANIFITADNKMKIGDFGISKVIDRTIIASKSFVGTPYYLSPQMVQGKPFCTKADIWALGVILYHMCAQKLPFQTNSLPLLALKIIRGSFPPLTGGNYSRQLKNLILNLLQTDQNKRPSVDAILAKPLLFKYLPIEIQQKMKQKNRVSSIASKKISKDLISMGKPKKKAKPKISEQEQKQLDKLKRQEYKSKRQEMRKQMREDLKKRRQQSDNNGQSENQSLQINSSSMNLINKQHPQSASKSNLSKLGDRSSTLTTQAKIQQRKLDDFKKEKAMNQISSQNSKIQAKPWKNKSAKSKKQVQVQLFLPENRPKALKLQQPEILAKKDVKVQIFVSGKHFELKKDNQKRQQTKKQEYQIERKTIKKQIQRIRIQSNKQICQKQQNFHYSQKQINQPQIDKQSSCQQSEQQQQIQEEIQYHNNYFNNIISDVKGVGQLVKNLSNPYGNIQLYQQSENFDQTAENMNRESHNKEQYEQMNFITNSENLQQVRLILEDRLGYENFVKAYKIIIEHKQESARKQAQDNNNFDQDYKFNKEVIKEKMNFLSSQLFQKNIVLLYSLTILQDEQMQNNFQLDD